MNGKHNLGPKPTLKDEDRGTVFEEIADRDEGILVTGPTVEELRDTEAMAHPYTPPSNVAAWLRKYEIEHPKGRDYEALMKAAKRKPVGYWEDAPRGAKFGGGVGKALTDADEHGVTRAKPAPSSDSDLYEPIGTVPVVGDRATRVKNDRFTWSAKIGEVFDITTPRFDKYYSFAAQGVAAGELEDRDFDAWRILKRPTKPRDDVATGARVWRCIDGWLRCNIGAESFMRRPDRRWERETLLDALKVVWLMTGNSEYTELHGPERDAIVAECRKAMGL